jgi:hypothetical protein
MPQINVFASAYFNQVLEEQLDVQNMEGKMFLTRAGTVPTTDTAPRIVWITYGDNLGWKLSVKYVIQCRRNTLCSSALEESVSVVV